MRSGGCICLCLIAALFPCFASEPWWELQTRMREGGRLSLSDKDWWPRAEQLQVGEELVLSPDAERSTGWMIVRREERQRQKGDDMIVWVLDDDGDMGDPPTPDTDSDCYVVDYDCDGTVDRMVDYIDTDGDQIPDEMDIRYFTGGELRRAWFGMDLDGDGRMWGLEDYEYARGFFHSDPCGNNMVYMNKYHPEKDEWLPISECPFAFFDTDGDGESEVVARFSAVPLDFSPEEDPDYANDGGRYQGPHYPSLENMGIVNIRYSFDIDGMSSKENPLHYEMGFNLVGRYPYQVDRMEHVQPLRRPPKTTICVPFDRVREIAETYPATQTGFTWREFEDATMRIGYPSRPEYDRRWEGVFWTWRRRIMPNTGGPVQDWNVRREFRPTASLERQLYYSPVDRRIHLKGATEGWLQVGHIEADEILGEIRTFDMDKDGYFDRWEYYDRDSAAPYRVSTVVDVANRDLDLDWNAIRKFYTDTALPDATRLDEELIAALQKEAGEEQDEVLTLLESALAKDISPDERRYILDLVRERYYRLLWEKWQQDAKERMEAIPGQDPRSVPLIMRDSTAVWERSVFLSRLDAAYSAGKFEKVIEMLKDGKP